MELQLVRKYNPEGTNGRIYSGEDFVCFTIELPWRSNQPRVSCIPEGRYEVTKRYSPKFHWHCMLMNVPDRSLILIHPANDAKKELRGCIAPVNVLYEPGKGLMSRAAFSKLTSLVFAAFERGEKVLLVISCC